MREMQLILNLGISFGTVTAALCFAWAVTVLTCHNKNSAALKLLRPLAAAFSLLTLCASVAVCAIYFLVSGYGMRVSIDLDILFGILCCTIIALASLAIARIKDKSDAARASRAGQ